MTERSGVAPVRGATGWRYFDASSKSLLLTCVMTRPPCEPIMQGMADLALAGAMPDSSSGAIRQLLIWTERELMSLWSVAAVWPRWRAAGDERAPGVMALMRGLVDLSTPHQQEGPPVRTDWRA
ncbi:hypothetical protein PCAR4_420030 [Paraburkholderia caribensis]|nr:hypothetical protein PCAR4_420030 [Paraburkholderia caribensis]